MTNIDKSFGSERGPGLISTRIAVRWTALALHIDVQLSRMAASLGVWKHSKDIAFHLRIEKTLLGVRNQSFSIAKSSGSLHY
jgi:hypothetical protein